MDFTLNTFWGKRFGSYDKAGTPVFFLPRGADTSKGGKHSGPSGKKATRFYPDRVLKKLIPKSVRGK